MKKPKLKQVLKKALAKKRQDKTHLTLQQQQSQQPQQHDPEQMTVRHVWSDGLETDIPYRAFDDQKILIVGDGDFSFSQSLKAIIGEDSLVCTSLDEREGLEAKYGQEVIERNLEGLDALHGIDGTKLTQYKALKEHSFSHIVFNYPHTGAGIKDRDRNIRAQQEMLKGFFLSAANLLLRQKQTRTAVTRNAISRSKTTPIALKKNKKSNADNSDNSEDDQRLTISYLADPEIHVTIRTGDPYDDWKIKGLAASTGLLRSIESFRFEPVKYPGYRHVRTSGQEVDPSESVEEDFLSKSAKNYVFKLKK